MPRDITLTIAGIEYTRLPLVVVREQLAAQGLHLVTEKEREEQLARLAAVVRQLDSGDEALRSYEQSGERMGLLVTLRNHLKWTREALAQPTAPSCPFGREPCNSCTCWQRRSAATQEVGARCARCWQRLDAEADRDAYHEALLEKLREQ
jgi:hypothetical protein